jgi:hypothetical protein
MEPWRDRDRVEAVDAITANRLWINLERVV